MDTSACDVKSLDHLGLVAGFCNEIGLAKLVDDLLPEQCPNKNIIYGQLLVAMILNGLGFTGRTLHMYPAYFSNKPVDRLIGPAIEAKHINDDVLGRCLDKLYEHDVSKIYQVLGEKVVTHLGLKCESINIDSTSFHVDGEYACDDDFKGIRLTRGYSRDHRPELNQVILNLITENQAGVPVYMQACSGNTNDSKSFKKLIKSHISSLKAAQRCKYLIGDASLYVAETIQALADQKQLFITRVPQKIKEAKKMLDSSSSLDFTQLKDGYSGVWVDSTYGNVNQKWLLVNSAKANKRELQTLHRRVSKSTTQSMKSFKKLCAKIYGCESDAKVALQDWIKEQQFASIANEKIINGVKHIGRGRPKTNHDGALFYQIHGNVYTCLEKVEGCKHGLFILSTNDISNSLSMEDLLSHYKSQQSVEKGFKFLKSPDFLTSSIAAGHG